MNIKEIKKGDVFKLKKEWRDKGDENYTWYALEDETDGRFYASVKENTMAIKPQFLIHSYMVEG